MFKNKFDSVSAHTLITEVFRLQKLSNELCSTCTRLSSWSNKHMREYLLSAGEDISSLANDMAKVNKTDQNLYYPWEFDILFRYSDLWATGVNLPMCVNFGHVAKTSGFQMIRMTKIYFSGSERVEWGSRKTNTTPPPSWSNDASHQLNWRSYNRSWIRIWILSLYRSSVNKDTSYLGRPHKYGISSKSIWY